MGTELLVYLGGGRRKQATHAGAQQLGGGASERSVFCLIYRAPCRRLLQAVDAFLRRALLSDAGLASVTHGAGEAAHVREDPWRPMFAVGLRPSHRGRAERK